MFAFRQRTKQRAAIREARKIIEEGGHIVALTGAGLSTRSGIPDFRTPRTGVWANADPMEVASLHGFKRDPHGFYSWLRPLANKTRNAAPNAAHRALAKLERNGKLKALITQNIDGLHAIAGSRNIYELHGSMREMMCLHCSRCYEGGAFIADFMNFGTLPMCDCGHVLKPSVTLFGENLPQHALIQAQREAQRCDVMIVAGSSLQVSPAADLPQMAIEGGARLIVVNLEESWVDKSADIILHADVTDILPQLT